MPAFACSPYAYDRIAHGVATFGMWGVFTLSELVVKPRLMRSAEASSTDAPPWRWDERCHGSASHTWRRISDATCAAALVLPLAATATAGLVAGGPAVAATAVASDVLLLAEASMAVNLLTTVFKLATRRPRPKAIEAQTPNVEYLLSFPSGHAATASCAATFATVAMGLRTRAVASTATVGLMGLALSSLTATGRVIGSMHYFSDVIGGTFVGSTVGFLVPWLARHVAA